MKIKETIERECCASSDLLQYNGKVNTKEWASGNKYFRFCKHCGQIWRSTKVMDAAGGYESDREKVII